MANLPVQLLDKIFGFAVARGIISPHDATLVCRRWKGYQKLIFKSVTLNPFGKDNDILDLDEHSHLIPYIEELCVGGVFPQSDADSIPPDFSRDLSVPFTNFLCKVQNPSSLVFSDCRIQWANISTRSINAFLTVFQRASFRALEVSVHTPLPSWMLLYGVCVAPVLTVHCIGPIMPPPLEYPDISYRCSLTRLELFGGASVREITKFCLEQRDLANTLLQNVVHLVLGYGETRASLEPPITSYADILVAFLAPQLEVLDIRVGSSDTQPSPVSVSALERLKALRCLIIHLAGCSVGHSDTLISAKTYMELVLSGLPDPSLIESLCVRVDDQRELHPRADYCENNYYELLHFICQQLSCAEKWLHLTSTQIVVDVDDNNFTESIIRNGRMKIHTTGVLIGSVLQINSFEAKDFGDLVTPQIC